MNPTTPGVHTPDSANHRTEPAPVPAARDHAGPAGANADSLDSARLRLALAQTALLSALVAGTPVPHGFDAARVRVQSRALATKRAEVTAKIAPELPNLLGAGYHHAFLTYALANPRPETARRDAVAFARAALRTAGLAQGQRRELTAWIAERTTPVHARAARLRRFFHRAGGRLAELRGGADSR